jgi:hypothetical protein
MTNNKKQNITGQERRTEWKGITFPHLALFGFYERVDFKQCAFLLCEYFVQLRHHFLALGVLC